MKTDQPLRFADHDIHCEKIFRFENGILKHFCFDKEITGECLVPETLADPKIGRTEFGFDYNNYYYEEGFIHAYCEGYQNVMGKALQKVLKEQNLIMLDVIIPHGTLYSHRNNSEFAARRMIIVDKKKKYYLNNI